MRKKVHLILKIFKSENYKYMTFKEIILQAYNIIINIPFILLKRKLTIILIRKKFIML